MTPKMWARCLPASLPSFGVSYNKFQDFSLFCVFHLSITIAAYWWRAFSIWLCHCIDQMSCYAHPLTEWLSEGNKGNSKTYVLMSEKIETPHTRPMSWKFFTGTTQLRLIGLGAVTYIFSQIWSLTFHFSSSVMLCLASVAGDWSSYQSAGTFIPTRAITGSLIRQVSYLRKATRPTHPPCECLRLRDTACRVASCAESAVSRHHAALTGLPCFRGQVRGNDTQHSLHWNTSVVGSWYTTGFTSYLVTVGAWLDDKRVSPKERAQYL